jgi:hypothetical protein
MLTGEANGIGLPVLEITGGAGEIRTPDLRFRKPALYPSELQLHFSSFYNDERSV